MPYQPTTWKNQPSTETPLSAANLNKLTDELESQATAVGLTHSLPNWQDGAAPAWTDAAPWNEMERVAEAVAASNGLGYTKTVWQEGLRNASQLNKLELQAQANRAAIETPSGTGTLRYRPPGWNGTGDPTLASSFPGYAVVSAPTTNGTLNLDNNTDYYVNFGTAQWSSSSSGRTTITVNGGRNVVIVGGEILFNSTNATDDAVGLLIDGGNSSGIVHIEGMFIQACNAITIRTPRIVQIQNVRAVCSVFNNNTTNIHPDVIQVWKQGANTPCKGIRVHRFSGYSNFTYFTDFTDEAGSEPYGDQTPLAWDLYDVDLHPISNLGLNNYMGYPPGATFRGENCWLETSIDGSGNRRGLGDQLRQFGGQYAAWVPRDVSGISSAQYQLFDAGNALLYTSPFPGGGNPSGTAGRTQGHRLRFVDRAEHPNLDGIEWRCHLPSTADGADASGNFVPRATVGPSYVSPRYV